MTLRLLQPFRRSQAHTMMRRACTEDWIYTENLTRKTNPSSTTLMSWKYSLRKSVSHLVQRWSFFISYLRSGIYDWVIWQFELFFWNSVLKNLVVALCIMECKMWNAPMIMPNLAAACWLQAEKQAFVRSLVLLVISEAESHNIWPILQR